MPENQVTNTTFFEMVKASAPRPPLPPVVPGEICAMAAVASQLLLNSAKPVKLVGVNGDEVFLKVSDDEVLRDIRRNRVICDVGKARRSIANHPSLCGLTSGAILSSAICAYMMLEEKVLSSQQFHK